MNKKVFQSRLLKNGLWLFVLQVFNTVVPMMTLPYVTRILGSAAYGEFSLAYNWNQYFLVIVEYGFAFWGSRKVATDGAQCLQDTFSKIITARIALMGVAFSAMCIIHLISGKELSHFICMSVLFIMVTGVAFQLNWLFQGMQDMKYITCINVVSRVISVILTFLLVKKTADVYLYCLLYSCTYIISASIGFLIARRKYGIRLKLCRSSDVILSLKEAWSLFISQAMSKVLSSFGITVLGITATSSAVGIYSAIYKIPYAMALFFQPISQAIYPDVSVAFGKSKEMGFRRVKKIALIVIPAFIAPSVLIMLFNKSIVALLFGQEYSGSSTLLIPLGVWFVFSVINNFLGIQILVGSGHQKEYSDAFLVSAVVSVVANIVFGKLWKQYGVAYTTCVAEVFLTGLLICKVRQLLAKKIIRFPG